MARKPAVVTDKKRLTKDEKAAAIAGCKDKQGRITPTSVVDNARHAEHPLHHEFDWDVRRAAQATWERRAAELIREVRFTIEYEDLQVVVPYYVSDPRDDKSSYVQTARVARTPAWAESVMRDELDRIRSSVHRAKALAAAFNLVNSFERMLAQVAEIERDLDEGDSEEAHHVQQ